MARECWQDPSEPSWALPSGGRWSRGEDLAPGGPRHTLPSPSPPATHGDWCRCASGLSFARSPSCSRGRPGTRSASPGGWGFAPQLARKLKPSWRSSKREFAPQMAQPKRCLAAQHSPELLHQHLLGQAGTRSTQHPPGAVAQHQALPCSVLQHPSPSACSRSADAADPTPRDRTGSRALPHAARGAAGAVPCVGIAATPPGERRGNQRQDQLQQQLTQDLILQGPLKSQELSPSALQRESGDPRH